MICHPHVYPAGMQIRVCKELAAYERNLYVAHTCPLYRQALEPRYLSPYQIRCDELALHQCMRTYAAGKSTTSDLQGCVAVAESIPPCAVELCRTMKVFCWRFRRIHISCHCAHSSLRVFCYQTSTLPDLRILYFKIVFFR